MRDSMEPWSHRHIDQKLGLVSNFDPSRIVAIPFQIVARVRGRRRLGTRMPNIARASAIFWFETLSVGS